MARMQGKIDPDVTHCAVGIDVSKAHLDVAFHRPARTLRVENTQEGITSLIPLLEGASVIVMEHTGPFHQLAWATFEAAGLKVAVLDAARVRYLSFGLGQIAKTDQLDAAMLAELGARLFPEPTPMPAQEHRDLKDLAVARAAMVRRRTAAKTQRSTSRNTVVQRLLAEEIAEFDKRIARIDSMIDLNITDSEQLARQSGILCSIPGIGPGTAAAILAWMPEIGTLSASEVGALSGTAPMDRSSGKSIKRATPKGGRRVLRSMLHMPGLSAMRSNPDFRAFRERLEARGKPTRLIRTAVIRKLLILANTLIAQDRLWEARDA